jgi:hypothetical protein
MRGPQDPPQLSLEIRPPWSLWFNASAASKYFACVDQFGRDAFGLRAVFRSGKSRACSNYRGCYSGCDVPRTRRQWDIFFKSLLLSSIPDTPIPCVIVPKNVTLHCSKEACPKRSFNCISIFQLFTFTSNGDQETRRHRRRTDGTATMDSTEQD